MLSLFIYNISIFFYKLAIYLTIPFNKKAKRFVVGQRNIFQYLEKVLHNNNKPLAWFHCASLGEFEQGKPVMKAFKKTFSHYQLLITFFSPSGYAIRKDDPLADYTCYLPLDSAKNARNFLCLVQPKLIFFIKSEFWYHYLNEAQRFNIPTFLIAAIFREEQLFFKSYGKIFRKMLQKFQHIFVQNKASIKLLQQINIQQVTNSGDTKFDNVQEIRIKAVPLSLIEKFKLSTPLLVIGSSWPEDIDVILPYINQTANKIKFIIAPHEINKRAINVLQQKIWKPMIRFSHATSVAIHNFDVLIIDNIGMLATLYQYADFAYIGGAFKQGLHNILEPATFGMPIFFGNKKYDNFPEACHLIEQGCAFAITDAEYFQKKFSEIYENFPRQKAIAQKTAHYVACNTGATEKIINYLKMAV